eukprot:TRINITY_DN4889_c1_g1_i1.p1 TRINITY_DN4889_c1_g1~~TRINITY_DN4889_c1_g1_i1.p1  ORF type:complete len:381 (+),score=82.96 TRINITY_DN4889_c1_g1_i1:1172-2314(+)
MREMLSRIMVQTARQTGLALVYRDLLSYEGSEFYFRGYPELHGQPFSVVQWRMLNAVVVGVRRPTPQGPKPVQFVLNPAENFIMDANDELLVIAEDSESFSLTASHNPSVAQSVTAVQPKPRVSEQILICGMSNNLCMILQEFDQYVLDGSMVYVMPSRSAAEFHDFTAETSANLKHLQVQYVPGDPTQPGALKWLQKDDSLEGCPVSVAMVVADDMSGGKFEQSDVKTVITVLLLREVFHAYGDKKPRIISEILDPRTKELLQQDIGSDFVVSTEITSMLLAQVSEHRDLNAVFTDLFQSMGCEIYLKRAACYSTINAPTPWLCVQKIARMRGEIAIGYLMIDSLPVINPSQTEDIVFTSRDRIIVVSEDDGESALAGI